MRVCTIVVLVVILLQNQINGLQQQQQRAEQDIAQHRVGLINDTTFHNNKESQQQVRQDPVSSTYADQWQSVPQPTTTTTTTTTTSTASTTTSDSLLSAPQTSTTTAANLNHNQDSLETSNLKYWSKFLTDQQKQQQAASNNQPNSSTNYASDDDSILEVQTQWPASSPAASSTTVASTTTTTIASSSPSTPLANKNSFIQNASELPSTTTTSWTTSASATLSSPVSNSSMMSFSNMSNQQQYSNVHPLLIYSIRYEIRSYDLFNSSSSPRSSSSSSSLASFNSPNTVYNAQQQLGTSNSNLASSSTGQVNSHLLSIYEQSQQQYTNKPSKTLIGGLKNTIGLDFYYSDSESYIFWTDVIEERIYKGTIINGTITNVEMVVQTGLATAEGLAVDWIGMNIYWVESNLDHIEVANMNGSSRKTLIAGDMESPRAIAVDPRYGLLFWTDWDKKSPRIERATMSGDDRKNLISIKEINGAWPNGLTLDYEYLKIYWIDANSDSIHVIDYEGKNHQTLLKHIKSLGHPFSITLFENNLYWTDWKTNSVSTANKHTGADAKEIQRLTNRLFDIKVFHPSRQPRIDNKLNPCFINNGDCSHLCLLSVNHTRQCECPNLMKLDEDNKTCVEYERVLLIGRTNEIRAVDISKPLYHIMAPISVPKVFSPRQFEYYAKTKSIFWADSQTNEVKRAQLIGTVIETIIDVIIESPSGLALDWISKNIYVTSAAQHKTPGKIYISNLEGEYISILMDSQQGLVSPKSIVVHPTLGLLFCIDEGLNNEPTIFMANMDGKEKQIIASKNNNPKLDNPSNLAIDYETNRVYWINQASNASIQYYDIYKENIVTILDESDIISSEKIYPSVLCVDGENLIISARTPTEAIIKMSKHDITNRTVLRTQNLDQLTALRVYNASTQIGTNACSLNNGNCSQLCIPTNATSRTCKCTMGFSLYRDNECLGKDSFLIFSYNLGMKGISLHPLSSPDDYYLPPIHRAFRASSIDYVHKDNLIYWVDNEEGSITRINRDTTNYKVIIQGLESEESIAIDWLAGNIYWLDPYYDIIEVARLNGTNRYVIVSGDMEKPNGIVVNPIKAYIAWSDVGSFPRIETARLDGNDRKIIVNANLSHIDDLTIDCFEDYIYWVDSTLGIVERIKPDGSDRHVIYNSDSSYSHLVSIAIYEEFLYIADSQHNHGSIIRVPKNNTRSILGINVYSPIQENLGEGIKDIAIYAEQASMSPEENPCISNNGGCQDLCLFMGKRGKKRCICSHGKLESDGLTCKPYDTFVLYSKLSQIDSLHITDDESASNSPYLPIMMENRSNIISLTVDYNARRVIYSDITRDQICSVHFNGTGRRVLVEKQSFVEGIAFANNQLYWTSIHDNSISRFNTTSSGNATKVCSDWGICRDAAPEKIIILTQDDKPRGIAIDSCTSYVYWTNWNTNASIQRASPLNNYKVESIIKTNIKVPNGIAIDQSSRKLYWCDARLDKIESCDMDGTNRIVLVSALPQHPFAIAIWENYVFWTDWLARGVFKADKYTGQQAMQIKKVVQRPMGIAVAAPEILTCPNNYCTINNGGCPENTACIMHYSSSRSVGFVECRPNNVVISHELTLPHQKHSCIPLGGGKSTCNSYHDIILNVMDRYNMTDLSPITTNTTDYETTSNNTTNASTYNGYMTPKSVFDNVSMIPTKQSQSNIINKKIPATTPTSKKTVVLKPEEATETNQSSIKSATTQQQVEDSRQAPKTNREKEALNNSTLITTTSSPDLTNKFTTTTSTTTVSANSNEFTQSTSTETNADGMKSQNTSIIPPTTASSVGSNTTLPPCQIVPAALQPTTETSSSECKLLGEFKCYLSEKLICIPGDRRCDGNQDCPSKEDENDCVLSKRGSYNLKRESNWHRFVTVILVILAAAVAALFLVFGNRNRRRWFVGSNGAFNHRRMFDDNGTNIEISNPMFDEDDTGNLVHCAFSIDLNERTTNFSNPLYVERNPLLLMNDKRVSCSK